MEEPMTEKIENRQTWITEQELIDRVGRAKGFERLPDDQLKSISAFGKQLERAHRLGVVSDRELVVDGVRADFDGPRAWEQWEATVEEASSLNMDDAERLFR